MDIKTKKFIRKPLVVDAVQVTTKNFASIALWCQGSIVNNDGSDTTEAINPGGQHIKVRVHNPKSPRQTKAFVGDWILYTERGYKIYTQKAFHASFDQLTGEEKDKADQAAKAREAQERINAEQAAKTPEAIEGVDGKVVVESVPEEPIQDDELDPPKTESDLKELEAEREQLREPEGSATPEPVQAETAADAT